jgi:tetratricopeptide (TPR) repeat protein
MQGGTMIPVAQVDPASLALWVNYEVLGKSPNFQHYRDIIEAAAAGDLTAVEEVLAGIPAQRTRIRALHLASMIWHEQRHFLDLTVTNYGARHFRSNFTVALNVFPLVADQAAMAGSELLLPIERYRTLPHGLRPTIIAPSLLAQATDIRRRRTFLRADTATLLTPKGPAKISGEGVLEALGFLHQHWSVAQLTSGNSSLDVLRDVPERLQRNMTYEWPALIAVYLEMAPSNELAHYPLIPGARLLSAMLLAALCPGYLDPGRSVLGVTDRFAFLIEKMKTGLARDLYASSFADCWAAVSAICRGEWGRTPEEEIAAEIELEEGMCARLVQRKKEITSDVAADFFLQYHANRARALEELRADVSFLDPTAGPEGRALPTPVYAIPNARPGAAMPGHFSLIGLGPADRDASSQQPEKLPFTWAFAPESWPPEGTVIGFRPDESWRAMLSLHIPAAKLMLNGLRHRAMLGPELATAREALEYMIRVKIDPNWDYSPVEETDLDQFLFLAETRSLPCDICDRSVSLEDGFLVSPTELRSDPASVGVAERVYARKLAAGSADERADIAALMVRADWSHWLLCDVCIDWLRPQRAAARSLAEKYVKDSESLAGDPEFAAVGVLGRAFVVQKEGLFPEAVELYQEALDMGDPEVSPVAAFSIGVLREAMGELPDAVDAYVVAMDPEWPHPSAKAAFNLGNLLKRADQIAGAATAYGMAANGADEEVTGVAHLARARCLASLKDVAGAVSSFRKVLETTDDPVCHQEAWLGIGQAYADEGHAREAIDALDKAMTGADDDLAAGAALVVVLYGATWNDPEAVNRAKAVIAARAGADLLEKLTNTAETEAQAG